MLEIYLTDGEDQGVWLKLPSSSAELGEAYAKLEEAKEYPKIEIHDVKSPVDGLADFLTGKPATYHSLEELDFLARRMEGMTEQEREIFGAAVQIEKPYTLMELVNLSCNLNKFAFYPDVRTEAELGKYLIQKDYDQIPEELAAALDYEVFGRTYAENHAGQFTQSGYAFRTGEALEPLYDGKCLPDPNYEKNSLLKVSCYKDKKVDSFYLPVPDMRLDYLRNKLRISSLEDFRQFHVLDELEGLKERLPCGSSIPELNRFAAALNMKLDGTRTQQKTLFAALEAEAPSTMERVIQIVETLGDYRIVMEPKEFKEPADFAHRALEISDSYYVDKFTARFLNFTALGKAMMKEEGAIQTTCGLVVNERNTIQPLPEELSSFKLFSPLAANLFTRHEWGYSDQPQEIDAYDLCEYEKLLRDFLKKESLEFEGERVLAPYLNNKLLERKVYSMTPTVEEWDGKLWGVLEVQAYGELSEGELEELKEEWAGQCSDGFGEGFEQRSIEVDNGEMYVCFWQPGNNFVIQTEQELKSGQSQGFGIRMGGM